jgi:soluble cytochrome b562
MKRYWMLCAAIVLALAFQVFSQATDPPKPMYSEDAMDMKMMQDHPKTIEGLLEDIAWQIDHIDTLIKTGKLDRVKNHSAKIENDCKYLSAEEQPADSLMHKRVARHIATLVMISGKLRDYGNANKADTAAGELEKARDQFNMLAMEYSLPAKPKGVLYKSPDTTVKNMNMKGMKAGSDTMNTAAAGGYWTCPMHPEVHQAKAGTCPVCGMDLVFIKTKIEPQK